MPASEVRVHIGALELRGFPEGTRHRVAGAAERELTRLIRATGLGRAPHQSLLPRDQVVARVERLRAADPPEVSGARIAYAIYRSLR